MRENRPYGLEGGETGLNGLPYPYAFGARLHDVLNSPILGRLSVR